MGELDSCLYASTSLVHQGVSLVVSSNKQFVVIALNSFMQFSQTSRCHAFVISPSSFQVTSKGLSDKIVDVIWPVLFCLFAMAASGTDPASDWGSDDSRSDGQRARGVWNHTVHWCALSGRDHKQPEEPLAAERWTFNLINMISIYLITQLTHRNSVLLMKQ